MWTDTPKKKETKISYTTRSALKAKKDAKLRKFSRDAYHYINQLFGDVSLRAVIQESMKGMPRWKMVHILLDEDDPDFRGGAHHILKGPGGETWDSLEVGLQDMHCNPNDTLCQSYSIAKYLDVLKVSDEVLNSPKKAFGHKYLLNRNRQFKLVQALRKTLSNPSVVEQLHYSVTIKIDNKWFMLGIDAKYRKKTTTARKGLVAKIRSILRDWKSFGWEHYDQDKKYSKRFTPFYKRKTPRVARSHIKKSIVKRKIKYISRRHGIENKSVRKNNLYTPSGSTNSRSRSKFRRKKIKF